MPPLTLYRHRLSGHCHRVELFLSILKLDFNMVEVDLAQGEHKTDKFLAMNKYGQVPVLTDGELVLNDSNSILIYLANAYAPNEAWNSSSPIKAAKIQKYLSLAAGPIANGPAAARLVGVFGADLDYVRAYDTALSVLTVIDGELEVRSWLTGNEASIADLAMYSYIAHAPEGGISLEPFRHLRRWLSRIEALPDFIPMARTETKLQRNAHVANF